MPCRESEKRWVNLVVLTKRRGSVEHDDHRRAVRVKAERAP